MNSSSQYEESEEEMPNRTVDARVEHQTFDEEMRQQHYQRLKFLIEKTTIYSKFLAEKLKGSMETEVDGASSQQRSSARGVKKVDFKCSFAQPKLITGGKLREYQLEGVEWLVSLFENGLNGILADEMGLGKTLQCISFLAFLREQGIWGPFLIVAPLSTIGNWVSEIERFAPSIPALLYHGSQVEREELRIKHLSNYGPKFPIVVTSYEIAMKDRKFLQKHSWKYLIVDEGHRIKNMNCKLVKELKSFQSANRLLLTGTPLQNNLAELWSLLNFLLPDIFDDLDSFQDWFDLGDISSDRLFDDEEAQTSVINSLHTILKPFLLRRLKMDVECDMPKKKEYLIYAAMTQPQHELYQSILTRRLVKNTKSEETVDLDAPRPKRQRRMEAGAMREPDSDDSFTLSEDDLAQEEEISVDIKPAKNPLSLQNTLMQLRKVCNHPFLFNFPLDSDGEPIIDESLVQQCGKMRLLDQLLPTLISRGHRVLIFSQMSRMLDILEDYLHLRGTKFCRIDGSIPQTERAAQIKAFNNATGKKNAIPVFLLTTRAGGLGINLTSADTVIFYDSDWNPQMDLQAQDRAHRIGQTKPVLVYRLATAGSIEAKILERAASKRRLEKLVIHQKRFKGKQQLIRKDEDRIMLHDLQAILEEQEMAIPLAAEGQEVLSKEDLAVLLDRSEQAFSQKEDPSSAAFRVIPETQTQSLL